MQNHSDDFILSEASDNELLRDFLDGNTDAFGQLFLRHKPKLLSVAIGYLKSREAAEDMVQTCFFSALRGAKNFRFQAQAGTWLHRILINACIDELKVMKRYANYYSIENLAVIDEVFVEAIDSEVHADLLLAINNLSTDQKLTLYLMDYGGYSIKEVAKICGCAESTIKSRHFRAKAKIKRLMEGTN
jgi:RNA polymerase sigma-70 factor (ECF subfamily)